MHYVAQTIWQTRLLLRILSTVLGIWNNSVSTTASTWFDVRQGREIFLFSRTFRQNPGPSQPPFKRVYGVLSHRKKRPSVETRTSCPPSYEVNNGVILPRPLYAFMAVAEKISPFSIVLDVDRIQQSLVMKPLKCQWVWQKSALQGQQ